MARRNLVRVDELSKYLAVSKSALYKWAKEGKIPSYQIGNARVFDLDEIDIWRKKNLRTQTVLTVETDDDPQELPPRITVADMAEAFSAHSDQSPEEVARDRMEGAAPQHAKPQRLTDLKDLGKATGRRYHDSGHPVRARVWIDVEKLELLSVVVEMILNADIDLPLT